MAVNRWSDEIEGWVVTALEKYAGDEDVDWHLAFGFLPQPQGLMPVWTIAIRIRGAIIGEKMLGTFLVQNPAQMTEATVDQVLREGLFGLREQRSQVLAAGNGQPPPKSP